MTEEAADDDAALGGSAAATTRQSRGAGQGAVGLSSTVRAGIRAQRGPATAPPCGIIAAYNTAGQLSSTKSGTTTNYGYAGANSKQLVSEAVTGGDTYQYAHGRAGDDSWYTCAHIKF